jgi:outer membrane protein assembly factor BamB
LLLALVGGAFAYYEYRLSNRPGGELDTVLAGVSVETSLDTTDIVTTDTTPTTTTTTKKNAPPPEECWRFYGGSPARSLSRPDIDLGVPTKVVWRRKFHLIEYAPTYCDGRLYVNLERGETLALNANNGRVLWRATHNDHTASSPAIWESLVIVSSHDGTVTAYKQENGQKVWRVRVPAKVESSPVVVDGLAYFGTTDGRLFAVNAATGNIRWAFNTGGRINASPSIWGRRIFISTYTGAVFCLDREDGHKIWDTYVRRNAFSYESFYASASTDGTRVYTTSRAGKVVAFSATTGRVLWTYQMGPLAYATPALAHGHVYVGSFDGHLRSLRASDGHVLWSTAIGGEMLGPAVAIGDLVFAATLGKNAVAVNADTGRIVWRYPKGRYSPGIATDRYYYLSLGGNLIKFQAKHTPKPPH